MIIVTVTDLKTYLVGYLNQRKAAYAVIGKLNMVGTVEMVERRFDLIRAMPFERHCREVDNCWNLLTSTLPSRSGRHASIRSRMLEFMNQCRTISNDSYGKRSSGKQMHIWETQKNNRISGQ